MTKSGFVYIWYDRKHKRYYIGCRWGHPDDGYICSSRWMRNAYKRRPQDFKRRILEQNISTRDSLYKQEYQWLLLIDKEKLGSKYYNLNNNPPWHWTRNPETLKSIAERFSRERKGKSFSPATQFKPGECRSPGTQFRKGQQAHNKGVPHSLEQLKKLSDAKKGKPSNSPTKFKPGQNKGAANSKARSINTPFGIFHTIAEGSKKLNIPYQTLLRRLKSSTNNQWIYI